MIMYSICVHTWKGVFPCPTAMLAMADGGSNIHGDWVKQKGGMSQIPIGWLINNVGIAMS